MKKRSPKKFHKKYGPAARRLPPHVKDSGNEKTRGKNKDFKEREDITRLVGMIEKTGPALHLRPASRKIPGEFVLAPKQDIPAKPGELALAEVIPDPRFGPKRVKLLENLGPFDAPGAVSLMAIAGQDIPFTFPAPVLAEAEALKPATPEEREDLRNFSLVTIDGKDARDFDDAVFAEADNDPANEGGWKLIVAIADVSCYVRAGTRLDREAYRRGNSVYFPDRVVPMLPEALSNELCSLKPRVDRACLAAHLTIDRHGALLKFRFNRAVMRSAARLTYEQVQAAANGNPDPIAAGLMDKAIMPLYAAYAVLLRARKKRGALDLDIQENHIRLGKDGRVAHIGPRERLDSHKLIEEFMVLANVAAATALQDAGMAGLYRVHDAPSAEKIESLREFLKGFGINLPPGKQLRPIDLARVLEKFIGTGHAPVMNEVMLRNQSQAVYSAGNTGHFGLALARYAHFTSPIRRYADLVAHRALVRLFRLGEGGLTNDERSALEETGLHISRTERRAIEAEREAQDRYASLYMAEQVGGIFEGRISGVTRSGVFVRLAGTGADGLLPMSSLPSDFYLFDEKHHRLRGRHHGRIFRLADVLRVRLIAADPLTGSLRFALAESDSFERRSTAETGNRPPRRGEKHRRSRSRQGRKF